MAADCPTAPGPSLGRFEAWLRVLGGILAVAGVPGFLGNLQEFYAASDDGGDAWREFVERWAARYGRERVTAADFDRAHRRALRPRRREGPSHAAREPAQGRA